MYWGEKLLLFIAKLRRIEFVLPNLCRRSSSQIINQKNTNKQTNKQQSSFLVMHDVMLSKLNWELKLLKMIEEEGEKVE